MVDEESLFANAVPVSSLEEWQQALQDPSTQAIQVTGDLELPPEGISHTIPVRVNEGVTVTVQESDEANAGPWYADGALVLNRGTILADFQTAGEERPDLLCAQLRHHRWGAPHGLPGQPVEFWGTPYHPSPSSSKPTCGTWASWPWRPRGRNPTCTCSAKPAATLERSL